MNNSTTSTTSKFAVGAVAVVAFALAAIPAFSQAASYAYVNQSGEVNMVVANDWMTAIATAPNRALRSGVILLNSQSDTDLIGDNVSGT